MSNPPSVLLSPRTPVRLPSTEIDIPPPRPAPSLPRSSLLYQILPVVFAALGMGVILLVGSGQAGGLMLALLAGTMLLVGGGAVVSIMNHRSQVGAYHRETRERLEMYYAMLNSTRDRIEHLLAEQQAVLLEKDPMPQTCARIATERTPRLWERSPDDPDFLVLRAGLGSQPSSTPVRPPRQVDQLEPDPLISLAEQLSVWASQVWGVPVFVPLGDGRAAGVCGQRTKVLETVRSLLIQLATHHAPDEVKLVALVPPSESAEWAWLRWLPHTWSDDRRMRFIASTPAEASRLSKRLEEILSRRRESMSMFTTAARDRPHLPVYVVLIADETLAESVPVLAQLNNPQDRLGASSLYLSSDRTRLPRTCRTILEVPAGVLSDLEANVDARVAMDATGVPLVEQVAAALAPLRAKRLASRTDLPAQVSLLELFEAQTVDALDVLDRWREAAPERSLAVPIGVRPGGEILRLDLHQSADGPHGLLAGSTGSGKSALMQSLLLGLTTSFHPHDLVIVLVDYKGGSTAGALQQLPHLVGTITNLDGNLARRALVALQAEIQRRQAALAAVGCDDLDQYMARRRRGEQLEPLPHLVLVVDEFAELKTERPDFIHQLVRTARVGRNVGIHLILATQKPRPAVDDEIWANARFRICLRVEQPQDSHDVLKRPDAASLVGRGQGYLQVGHDEVFTLFLGGWGGAPYRPDAGPSDPHEVALVDLDGTRRAVDATHAHPLNALQDPTQAEALTRHLAMCAQAAGIARLPAIWLAPLEDRIVLADLLEPERGWDNSTRTWRPTHRWIAPVVGQVDDPAHREQAPLRIDLPHAGNLTIYGAPGAGKTTALLSLGLALACEHTPADVQLYLVDFGGQALATLRDLPHVGGVVFGEEEEKLVRLLRWIGGELARRKALFGETGVGTLPAYRAASPVRMPAIVLLIDNLPALLQTYPDLEDLLALIAQQGGTFGIHSVITATSPTLVRLRIANSFSQILTLRLVDRTEYSTVLSLPEGYETPAQPGRGLVKGRPTLECRVAVPAGGASEAEQTALVRRLASDMNAAWQGPRPWQVRTLPETIALADVLHGSERIDGAPIAPVGISVDDLEPFRVDLRDGPHFLIVGPPRGGKSTLLRTWVRSLQLVLPPDRLRVYLADFSTGGSMLPGVRCIANAADLAAALDEIAASAGVTNVLAIDDLEGLKQVVLDDEVLERLNALARARQPAAHILLAGTSSAFASSYDGIGMTLKQAQTGFLVGGSDYDDMQVIGIHVPHAEATQGLPPGQGYYARRKHYTRVKIAEPPIELATPEIPPPAVARTR